jgi:O-antigen/teichoic acid export membrane protein
MTESEYGTADFLYQTLNVLYPVLTLCMADAAVRFGLDKGYNKKQVYSIAVFSTVLGMAFFALCSPALNLFDVFYGYGFLFYIYCYFSCFRSVAASFVRARGLVRLFAFDGILSTLTIVISNIILLKFLDLGVKGYIISIIISDVLSWCFLTVIAGLHKYLDLKYINMGLFKQMLKYALPLIPTYVLWWVTSSSDRWFIVAMRGLDESGIYAAASKIPGLLMILTTLFFQAWQMSAIDNKDDRGLSKFFSEVYGVYSSLLFVAGAGIITLVKPLTYLLVGGDPEKNYILAYHYTPVLIIAMLFQCLCQFLSSVYTVKKLSVNSLFTSLAAAGLNIPLNFLLIPKYGLYGAAIATALSYLICFIIRLINARAHVSFKVSHLKAAASTVIISYMAYAAVAEPKLAYLRLALLFLTVTILNFSSIIKVFRKIISKNKAG